MISNLVTGIFSWVALFFLFRILYTFSKITENFLLITFIRVYYMIVPLSTFLFFIYSEIFTIDGGWRTIKDFNINFFSIFNLYFICFIYLFILILFTYILENIIKYKKNYDTFLDFKKLNNSSLIFNFIYISLISLATLLSIFMYYNNIAITGIPSDPIPYRAVGILSYVRKLLIPALLLIVYQYTSKSLLIFIITSIYALLIGVTSASKLLTILYILPCLINQTIQLSFSKSDYIKFFILLLFYQITDFARDHIYLTDERSIISLLLYLYYAFLNYVNNDFLLNISMSFFGLITRISNTQGLILGSQHQLINPLLSLNSYLFNDYLIQDPALTLFSLTFSNEYNFGVSLGFLGNLIFLHYSSIFAALLLILYISFLIIFLNFLLSQLDYLYITKSFLSFVITFQLIEGTIIFIYYYASILIALNTIQFFYRPNKSL